jgi:hypothetical protein
LAAAVLKHNGIQSHYKVQAYFIWPWVLGLAAWGRTQEKLGGANNGGLAPVSQSVTTTFGAPAAGGFGSSNGPAATNSFGAPAPTSSNPSSAFGNGTFESQQPAVVTGFGGKKAPAAAYQPEL